MQCVRDMCCTELWSLVFCVSSTANDSGGDLQSFLPFGPDREDLTVPSNDDGTTDEIILRTDVVFFGSSYNRLYVSQHDMMNIEFYFRAHVVTRIINHLNYCR